mmetsp:Transcript_4639/g.10834  ORF Transcript_4639/g.10834 Transcript_4639/m.10834 type:complete len:208 (-) Transcript_4639:8-631(-)
MPRPGCHNLLMWLILSDPLLITPRHIILHPSHTCPMFLSVYVQSPSLLRGCWSGSSLLFCTRRAPILLLSGSKRTSCNVYCRGWEKRSLVISKCILGRTRSERLHCRKLLALPLRIYCLPRCGVCGTKKHCCEGKPPCSRHSSRLTAPRMKLRRRKPLSRAKWPRCDSCQANQRPKLSRQLRRSARRQPRTQPRPSPTFKNEYRVLL